MAEVLPIRPGLALPLSEIELRTSRSSGPGGQHANVTASAQDTRSQHRNRELALERLADRIAHALEVRRPRTKTRPTRASQRRRVESKKRRGEVKKARRRPDY
jgi:ribosome-associated protein